jgi:DNA-binding HxlR family transcriptional regulator
MELLVKDDVARYSGAMKKQDDAECPVARTLSVIGSSWVCLILRDLLLHGARRFQDLQNSLAGIAPTTLSERLKALEQNGILERRFYSMSPPRAEYVLTAKGGDLGPIVRAMRDWGGKYAR